MRLKELIGEIYEPRSPDEARFIQKHVTKLFQNIYAGTEYDPLFKGSKVKYVDRSAENHGYDPGADEKVYEEAELDEENYKIPTDSEISAQLNARVRNNKYFKKLRDESQIRRGNKSKDPATEETESKMNPGRPKTKRPEPGDKDHWASEKRPLKPEEAKKASDKVYAMVKAGAFKFKKR
jgi:hypothetical protein